MEMERQLAEYVSDTTFEEIPREVIDLTKDVVFTILGCIIAGAAAEGCEILVNNIKEFGGKEEATILIYGGQVPAHNAAFVNSAMARALDFDGGMDPGIHIAASSVPTALAVAELVGGCSGKEFLTAIILGTEIASRINFSSIYNGFDPTGVCTIFATTSIAGRMLRLNSKQMLNALALAFNKSGGSFQSNIDGSLAVRVIQGWVSEAGVICARLAQTGITGPQNFLEGTYGYFHLYAGDKYDPQLVAGELGKRFEMKKRGFKKYPSCGCTATSIEAALNLVNEKRLEPDDVVKIDVKTTLHCYKICGHPFEIKDNPRVNAQFNIRYCVANALLRKGCRLVDFDESSVRDPRIMELVNRINVTCDPALERRGLQASTMEVVTKDGTVYHQSVDVARRGFPGNPPTSEELIQAFQDCVSYAAEPLPQENIEQIISLVNTLEEVEDARSLILPMLVRS